MQLRHAVVSISVMAAACTDELPTAESVAAIGTPNIKDALTCYLNGWGVLGEVGLPPVGNDLQGYVIPTSVFPDARCNDDTPAILYFRPGTGDGLKSWLIELEGGGSCGNPEECANRWCSEGTSFGRQNMSSLDYVAQTVLSGTIGIAGIGLQSVSKGPFADFNHVFIHYCSSDGWAGTTSSIDGMAPDPWIHSQTDTFSTRFDGNAILEAAIRVLRQDGATLPAFSPTGASMPDLDNAEGDVVIAGGSAGGAGVIFQLDRTVDDLRANHSVAYAMPYYAGLIDSAFPPNLSGLGFQLVTDLCHPGNCVYPTYVVRSEPYYTHLTDDSCQTYHATDGNDFECLDVTHLIHHHIGTPFFVRQSELDSLLTTRYEDAKIATSTTATRRMNDAEFGLLVLGQALGISSWTSNADEPPTTLPGAFVPTCKTHYPVHDRAAWFDTTIDSLTWDQVWQNWRAGSGVRIEVGVPGFTTSVCKCMVGGVETTGGGC